MNIDKIVSFENWWNRYRNYNLHFSKIRILFRFCWPSSMKSTPTNSSAIRIFVPICGKCGNCYSVTAKTRVCTPLKLDIYFQFVSETIGVKLTMFPSRMQHFVKPVKNCICNRSRTNGIDTEIAFCTSLKFELYFQFWWKLSTKSKLINFNCLDFCDDLWKTWQQDSRNCQNQNLHTSKIHISGEPGLTRCLLFLLLNVFWHSFYRPNRSVIT